MPFKSKKQKKTIDAAAHNPTFAKKVGIKVSDAKKMSAHGKGQTKFQEATDTVEKDEKGNVKSWKHEGDWKKADPKKDPRGKVTNASDKARRKTEKMSKPEKEMAEAFETALEGSIRGGVWTSQKPDKGQKDVPPPQNDDQGTLKPMPKKAPTKKAEIEQPTQVAATGDDAPVAEGKTKSYSAKKAAAGKDIGKPGKNFEKIAKKAEKGGAKSGKAVAGAVLKKLRAKQLAESIQYLGELIAEAKQASKKAKPDFLDVDKDSNKKETFKKAVADKKKAPFKKVKEGAKPDFLDMDKDGNKNEPMKIAVKDKKVAETTTKVTKEKEPEGTYSKKRFETDGQRVARLAKEKRQAEKKKVAESKDLYMESLYQKLQNQLNG